MLHSWTTRLTWWMRSCDEVACPLLTAACSASTAAVTFCLEAQVSPLRCMLLVCALKKPGCSSPRGRSRMQP